MPRRIDHVVFAVRDLDNACEAFHRLGFMSTSRTTHPFGTGNSTLQFSNQTYVELLAVLNEEEIPKEKEGQFNFAAFNRNYIAKHEGISMLAVTGQDPSSENLEFAAAGAEIFDCLDFKRMNEQPNGKMEEINFSLIFAMHPALAEMGFFSCKHHNSNLFWHESYQHHANGAKSLMGIVMVANDPADHHAFISAFIGQRDMHSTSLGIEIAADNGSISILSPVAFKWRYGIEASADPVLCRALRFAVNDLAKTQVFLENEMIPFDNRFGALVIPPSEAQGVAIILE